MRKLFFFLFLISFSLPTFAADNLDTAIHATAAYLLKTVKNPQVDPVGGDWAVFGLARSNHKVPDSFYKRYHRNVERYVKKNKGILHDIKYTEYSRVILALSATGYDARDVAGYDLTAPLNDFDKTIFQGINGAIWALIALDSMDYPNDRRENYIDEILRRQLLDGGWSLAGGEGDPDITGMALQALARYQHRPAVKKATDKALLFLSAAQTANGGYESWGSENVESTVQVLVALCEMGIPFNDARFIKNGNTLVDNILSFQNADGSYKDLMATEQALYGLVAIQRVQE